MPLGVTEIVIDCAEHATVIGDRRMGDVCWTVPADPEGNELCVSGDA